MTDVHLCLVPWTKNTAPGGFDEQRFQKEGLKGALVVVVTRIFRKKTSQGGACLTSTHQSLPNTGVTITVAPFFVVR